MVFIDWLQLRYCAIDCSFHYIFPGYWTGGSCPHTETFSDSSSKSWLSRTPWNPILQQTIPDGHLYRSTRRTHFNCRFQSQHRRSYLMKQPWFRLACLIVEIFWIIAIITIMTIIWICLIAHWPLFFNPLQGAGNILFQEVSDHYRRGDESIDD